MEAAEDIDRTEQWLEMHFDNEFRKKVQYEYLDLWAMAKERRLSNNDDQIGKDAMISKGAVRNFNLWVPNICM